ncbi:DUF4339 domain-containing protein [Crateriforma conspicua]|nr:DUF4339 domain-containing protein [Crateriforma conspicua]
MHELSSDGLSWLKAEDFGDFFDSGAAQVQPVSSELISATVPTAETEPTPTVAAAIGPTSPAAADVEWFAHINDESIGPMSGVELETRKNAGQLTASTMVWRSGFDAWQTARQALPELFGTSSMRPQNSVDVASGNEYGDVSINPTSGDTTAVVIAAEMTKHRGWILFTAIAFIVLAVLQILLQVVWLFVVAKSNASNNFTSNEIFAGIFAIIFAAIEMTGGILLLQYSGILARIERGGAPNLVTSAIRKLNAFWSFAGLAMLVVVILVVIAMIAFFSNFLAFVR